MPLALQPYLPVEDARRLPGCVAKGALVEVEGVAQSAGGTLIGGKDEVAARQRLINLGRQRGGEGHTLFIRLMGAEKAASEQVSELASQHREVSWSRSVKCRCDLRGER